MIYWLNLFIVNILLNILLNTSFRYSNLLHQRNGKTTRFQAEGCSRTMHLRCTIPEQLARDHVVESHGLLQTGALGLGIDVLHEIVMVIRARGRKAGLVGARFRDGAREVAYATRLQYPLGESRATVAARKLIPAALRDRPRLFHYASLLSPLRGVAPYVLLFLFVVRVLLSRTNVYDDAVALRRHGHLPLFFLVLRRSLQI